MTEPHVTADDEAKAQARAARRARYLRNREKELAGSRRRQAEYMAQRRLDPGCRMYRTRRRDQVLPSPYSEP